jgi:hypothetical protein
MEPISAVLFKIYRGTPQHEEWVIACLQGAWPRLLGEKLSQVCRPVGLTGSVLRVEILDAAWEDAIRGNGGEILQRLRVATGDEVRQVSYEVGGREA